MLVSQQDQLVFALFFDQLKIRLLYMESITRLFMVPTESFPDYPVLGSEFTIMLRFEPEKYI